MRGHLFRLHAFAFALRGPRLQFMSRYGRRSNERYGGRLQ
jgi:hypothetical protein